MRDGGAKPPSAAPLSRDSEGRTEGKQLPDTGEAGAPIASRGEDRRGAMAGGYHCHSASGIRMEDWHPTGKAASGGPCDLARHRCSGKSNRDGRSWLARKKKLLGKAMAKCTAVLRSPSFALQRCSCDTLKWPT